MTFRQFFSKSKPTQDVNLKMEDGEPLQVDTSSPILWGIGVLIFGFGSFLLWAAYAPLDEGVPAQGVVSIDTKRKLVQHLTGGIIQEVHVKEGQLVKTGDILLTLDSATAKARYEEVRQRYVGDRALENRLLAEQTGAKSIQFHEDLQKMRDDLLVQQHMRNQEMLLISRRAALSADLQSTEESIHGQEAQIQGLTDVLASRKSQLGLINEQLSGIRDLVQEGYAPKSQQRDLELRVAQATGDIADSQSAAIRAKHAIAELRQRGLLRKEEYRKEVDTQMSQVRMEVDVNAEKLKALSDDLDRTKVLSPVDGQVVGLQFQTIGSVIQPGQKILEVVPLDEILLLEVKVAPHLIDSVRTGQSADIRFDSFANSPQLAVEGKVDSISKDLLTEPNMNPAQPGASYYLARISVTPKGISTLGGRVLQSGMPAQVIVKTGERSLLTYLMHPFMKRLAASLKEK
jgi:protease secretion system membrane fusion protein